MIVVLFAFWLLLNGRWTTEVAVVGAVLAALETLFLCKFFGYSPRRTWQFVRRLPRALAYLGFLIGEIFKAGAATIRLIWSPTMVAEPRLVSFRSRLKTGVGRVMLANSITLTPGTITVALREDRYLVHCLDSEFAEGLENSEMERRLLRVEGDGSDA